MFRLNHYAQPVRVNIKSAVESAVIEFCIGCICAGFAYVSHGILIQLYYPMEGIAVVCLLLTFYNIYNAYSMWRDHKPDTEVGNP